MKKARIYTLLLVMTSIFLFATCKPENIDDQGLLITQRSQCYMSFFDLLGSDHRTVLASTAVVDTVNLTVTAVARFGTNIKRVKPYCSVVTDAIVEPTMGLWTDFSTPQTYTVVSGNRQVRKTYTVTITVQQ